MEAIIHRGKEKRNIIIESWKEEEDSKDKKKD